MPSVTFRTEEKFLSIKYFDKPVNEKARMQWAVSARFAEHRAPHWRRMLLPVH